MKSNTRVRPIFIAAGILSLAMGAIAAPFPANRTANGWEEIALSEAVPNESIFSGPPALDRLLAVGEDEVATVLLDGRVVVINDSDGMVRHVVAKPAGFPSNPFGSFGETFAFIQGKLVLASLPEFGKVRIDELDVVSGAWLRTSTQTTTWYPSPGFLQPPVLEGDVLSVPYWFGGSIQWNQSDWSVHDGASAAVTVKAPAAGVQTLDISPAIPLNGLHIVKGLTNGRRGLAVHDPSRLNVQPVEITTPFPESSYAGASRTSLWQFAPSARRGLGFKGTICRFPLTAMPQVVEVKLSDSSASEHDGKMRFKITAKPVPVLPVTVNLETVPGSAEESADYEPWAGSVVLTPENPSTEVSITILEDQKLEWCETFALKVKDISNAWCFDRDAVGVIKGTSFVRTTNQEPLPEGNYAHAPVTVDTPAGMLSLREIAQSGKHRIFFNASGTAIWEDWTDLLPLLKQWQYPRIADVEGNRVCIRGMPAKGPDEGFAVVDTLKKRIIAHGLVPETSEEFPMLLHGDSLMMPSAPNAHFENYYALVKLPDLTPLWTVKAPSVRIFRHSQDAYLIRETNYDHIPGYDSGIYLRRFSNASWAADIVTPLGSENEFLPIACKDGTSVFQDDGSLYIHRFAEDGTNLYQYFPKLSGSAIVGSSQVCFVIGNKNIQALDPETGATLALIEPPPSRDYIRASADRGNLIVGESPDTVSTYVTRPSVPCPLRDAITAEETADPVELKVAISETVSYPLSARLVWCSSPQDLSSRDTPELTPAGSDVLTLPFRIADDNVPEREETLRVIVEVSGDGHSERFGFTVSIAGNDIVPILKSQDVIECSSLDLGGGAPIFGNSRVDSCYDPVRKSVYQPTSFSEAVGRFYGHAVACSKTLAVVGAPGIGNRPDPGLVYIYDRKDQSRTALISHGGSGSAFGSVLHLDGSRLYVGAPGEPVAGEVVEYSMPGGKPIHSFTQTGKPRIGNRFGVAIASDAESVWIGAPGVEGGAVYQFAAATGRLQRVIRPEVPGTENFGHSLSVVGPYLAVGAPSETAASGVFLYQKKSGKLAKRIPSPFKDGGYFGASLANLKDVTLAVGCPTPHFAKYGGILVYDVTTNPCRMRVMLEPSMKQSANHPARSGRVGLPGSLCSYGDFLGIQVLSILKNPLNVLAGRSPRDGYAEILKLKFPDSTTKSALVETPDGSVWNRALGLGAGDPLPELTLRSENGEANVSLPDLDHLSSSSTVFLERSDDLITWSSVARYEGSGTDGWVPLSAEFPIARDGAGAQLRAKQGNRVFFRLKCVTGEPD